MLSGENNETRQQIGQGASLSAAAIGRQGIRGRHLDLILPRICRATQATVLWGFTDLTERESLPPVTVKGFCSMGKALPKSAVSTRKIKPAPFRQYIEKPDIQALEEENAKLRELVTELSEIVIKNIVDNIEDG
jgi:hypothetical protein